MFIFMSFVILSVVQQYISSNDITVPSLSSSDINNRKIVTNIITPDNTTDNAASNNTANNTASNKIVASNNYASNNTASNNYYASQK